MPALSPTMTEGTLARWLKAEGDKIEPGQVIAEIETDKATMEVEAVDEGILAKIVVQGGVHGVKVNSLIGIIAVEGENVETATQACMEEERQVVFAAPQTKIMNDSVEKHHIEERTTDRVFISPVARKIAKQENIDISTLSGSGPYGRIIKRDIIAAIDKSSAASETTVQTSTPVAATVNDKQITLSTMRRVIGQRLLESKTTIPHFYLSVECNVTKLLELRNEINKTFTALESTTKISVNDMIVKAASYALQDIPEVNASWAGDSIIQYGSIDISIAVALDDGLITPIVRNANIKSLSSISSEVKKLVKKARDGKLMAEEFQGGGFSISNLGMYNIHNFFAIINPPQSCILAVGCVVEKPIIVDGQISIGSVMSLSISCDHRVIDGAIAAKFLSKLGDYLENPLLLCC